MSGLTPAIRSGEPHVSTMPFFTTPILSLQRLGWIGLGDSRVFLADALGGFYSLREQIAQEIGPEAEAEMVQRAGFSSAEHLVAAGRENGELTPDEDGFQKALILLSFAGYGSFRAVEVRFDEQWARVVADGSVEGWMFRESGSRPNACCDYVRGMLAGIMHYLSIRSPQIVGAEDIGFGMSPQSSEPSAALDISCVETSCIAVGEESCQFVLGPSSLLLAEGLTPAPMAHSSVRETLLRLNRQLEQILDSSRKDPLTKLYNRSFFESALRQRIGYAKRRSDVVSLAIIDIDYFKSINDTHGHTVGDRVLRQIARSLEQQARENDIVSRLGGDEFVWLMPATGGDAALAVAQRLRRMIEDLTPTIGFSISASIGVANYPQDAASPAELFERADSALFTAKRAGRDRVMRFAPAPSSQPPAVAAAGSTNGSAKNSHGVSAPVVEPVTDPASAFAPIDEPQLTPDNLARTAASAPRSPVKPHRGLSEDRYSLDALAVPARAEVRPPSRTSKTIEPERDAATEEAFPRPPGTKRLKKVRY